MAPKTILGSVCTVGKTAGFSSGYGLAVGYGTSVWGRRMRLDWVRRGMGKYWLGLLGQALLKRALGRLGDDPIAQQLPLRYGHTTVGSGCRHGA